MGHGEVWNNVFLYVCPATFHQYIRAAYALHVDHFSVFTIVKKTSTEASLAPGIDQLYIRNTWSAVH